MVKTIPSANTSIAKLSSVPDAEKSMQELTAHFNMVQDVKNKREEYIREACTAGILIVEQNIVTLKADIKKLKSNREFLMAKLNEEKLLQHLEAKKLLMNKELLK